MNFWYEEEKERFRFTPVFMFVSEFQIWNDVYIQSFHNILIIFLLTISLNCQFLFSVNMIIFEKSRKCPTNERERERGIRTEATKTIYSDNRIHRAYSNFSSVMPNLLILTALQSNTSILRLLDFRQLVYFISSIITGVLCIRFWTGKNTMSMPNQTKREKKKKAFSF